MEDRHLTAVVSTTNRKWSVEVDISSGTSFARYIEAAVT